MSHGASVAELVNGARQGDPAAWDELVERFLPLVCALVARHRLRGQDADDVNQTVWLRLVEHLADLREPDALPGWIVATTRHECLRVIRKARRTVSIDPQSATWFDEPDRQDDVAEGMLVLERQQALRAALAELPEDRRELLTLLLRDPPLPYREVSRILGIPVGSIGPTRARALDQLRGTEALRGLLAEPPAEQRR